MAFASRLGFRGRLISAMIALVALVSLVIIALLMVYLFEDEKSRALEKLTIGERLTREVIERRTELELSRLSVLVQDFGFRSAVASGDSATMTSTLENHSARVGASFALLLNAEGDLLASTLNRRLPGISSGQLAGARRNGFARSLLAIDGRGYEILAIPVEAPGLRAWLVTGFVMDQALAESIARLSGTSVIFRARADNASEFRSFAATTGIDSNLEQELSRASDSRNFIESGGYFTRIINLGNTDPAPIQAVLLISREATLDNYYRRAVEIALLVSAILVLSIIVALVIARN
ncbi:MAG: diguanylate phosphodiesterase, partial [Marinobacter sp.]|nr:diguanylate phosphodiesterase [Marinobacter sp.]